MDCSTLGFLSFTIFWSLFKPMPIEPVMPSNHLILCCPLLLLPSVFPSIRIFSNELALHVKCTKYWSFSLSISPSNEHSGLSFFKIDWFDLFAVQGTLKSFLHHSLKASVQFSHVRLFVTPWTAAHQTSLSITNSQSLLKLMSIELVMPSNHHSRSSPSPPEFNLSQLQGFF